MASQLVGNCVVFNVAFVGPAKSGKSVFMDRWVEHQSIGTLAAEGHKHQLRHSPEAITTTTSSSISRSNSNMMIRKGAGSGGGRVSASQTPSSVSSPLLDVSVPRDVANSPAQTKFREALSCFTFGEESSELSETGDEQQGDERKTSQTQIRKQTDPFLTSIDDLGNAAPASRNNTIIGDNDNDNDNDLKYTDSSEGDEDSTDFDDVFHQDTTDEILQRRASILCSRNSFSGTGSGSNTFNSSNIRRTSSAAALHTQSTMAIAQRQAREVIRNADRIKETRKNSNVAELLRKSRQNSRQSSVFYQRATATSGDFEGASPLEDDQQLRQFPSGDYYDQEEDYNDDGNNNNDTSNSSSYNFLAKERTSLPPPSHLLSRSVSSPSSPSPASMSGSLGRYNPTIYSRIVRSTVVLADCATAAVHRMVMYDTPGSLERFSIPSALLSGRSLGVKLNGAVICVDGRHEIISDRKIFEQVSTLIELCERFGIPILVLYRGAPIPQHFLKRDDSRTMFISCPVDDFAQSSKAFTTFLSQLHAVELRSRQVDLKRVALQKDQAIEHVKRPKQLIPTQKKLRVVSGHWNGSEFVGGDFGLLTNTNISSSSSNNNNDNNVSSSSNIDNLNNNNNNNNKKEKEYVQPPILCALIGAAASGKSTFLSALVDDFVLSHYEPTKRLETGSCCLVSPSSNWRRNIVLLEGPVHEVFGSYCQTHKNNNNNNNNNMNSFTQNNQSTSNTGKNNNNNSNPQIDVGIIFVDASSLSATVEAAACVNEIDSLYQLPKCLCICITKQNMDDFVSPEEVGAWSGDLGAYMAGYVDPRTSSCKTFFLSLMATYLNDVEVEEQRIQREIKLAVSIPSAAAPAVSVENLTSDELMAEALIGLVKKTENATVKKMMLMKNASSSSGAAAATSTDTTSSSSTKRNSLIGVYNHNNQQQQQQQQQHHEELSSKQEAMLRVTKQSREFSVLRKTCSTLPIHFVHKPQEIETGNFTQSLRQMFDRRDDRASGFITKKDAKKLLEEFDPAQMFDTEMEIRKVCSSLPCSANTQGFINFDQFVFCACKISSSI